MADHDQSHLAHTANLARALQNAWDEYIADTGFHPGCFEMKSGKLYADFAAGNFVSMTAGWLYGSAPDGSRVDTAATPVDVAQEVDILFDGPPAAEAGRFIEVEDLAGHGVGVGEWIDRGDGTWALRVSVVGVRR